MAERPTCGACLHEIHRDSAVSYMGTCVQHRHRRDCLDALLADLEAAREESREWNFELRSVLQREEKLADENERLRKALEHIRKHLEIAGGEIAKHSTTWLIADRALNPRPTEQEPAGV